jgi:hypothetical protein
MPETLKIALRKTETRQEKRGRKENYYKFDISKPGEKR